MEWMSLKRSEGSERQRGGRIYCLYVGMREDLLGCEGRRQRWSGGKGKKEA